MTKKPLLCCLFVLTTLSCSGGESLPNPCPTTPNLDQEARDKQLTSYDAASMNFESEIRIEQWASNNETDRRMLYENIDHDDLGEPMLASIECRSQRCMLTFEYVVRVSGTQWVGGESSGLYGSLFDALLSREPCGFFLPGVATVRNPSCATFEIDVFLNCDER